MVKATSTDPLLRTRIETAMTKARHTEAAEAIRRLIELIDQGEVNAPGWLRERQVGAMLRPAWDQSECRG
jgi:hypothetical protein